MKAIRAYCLDCAGRPAEVRKCVATLCPLWPLRMGRWPGRLGATPPPAESLRLNRAHSAPELARNPRALSSNPHNLRSKLALTGVG